MKKTKIIMLISVLFNSTKFKYIVLPNIKDNKLLSGLNFGISKVSHSQHIDFPTYRQHKVSIATHDVTMATCIVTMATPT